MDFLLILGLHETDDFRRYKGFFALARFRAFHRIKLDLDIAVNAFKIGAEMLFQRFARQKFFRARLDGKRRHDDHEFEHAQHAVQLIHGFGVGVGFARARFHLNIDDVARSGRRAINIVQPLQACDIALQEAV